MRLSKIYENAKDNAAFDRCVDVMAKLMLKYGSQVLEQQEKSPAFLIETGDLRGKRYFRTLLKNIYNLHVA